MTRPLEPDLGPVIGDAPMRRVHRRRSDGPDPLPGVVLSIVVSASATVLAALLGVVIWLAIGSVARGNESLVRVPPACAPLAHRFGVPLVLTREQAAAALIALQQIQTADADVQRCRRALSEDRK